MDFTTIRSMFNSGSDAAPTWNPIAFGGTLGANEIRWCATGAGAAGTPSATWPQFPRPVATAPVPELWGFSGDTTGIKVATYDGTLTHANVLSIDYDNLGSFALPPTLSAWGDTTHVAPVSNAQPGAFPGSPIVNGSADTGGNSYLKGNMYGTAQVANPTAGNAGATLLVTSGTAGSVSPGVGVWLATWQSLQGAIQFITAQATPAITTAGKIFFNLVLFSGPAMSLGLITPVVTFTYSYV